MKKKIIVFLILISSFVFPLKINAAECNNEFKSKMIKLSNQIDISYEYIDNIEETNTFKFKISNLPNEMVVEEDYTYYQFSNSNGNDIVETKAFEGGKKIKFFIIYNGQECDKYLVRTKSLKLPIYNEYWNKEICSNAKDYVYCQKFINNSISEKTLKENINKYEEKNKAIITKEKSDNFFNNKLLLIGISGLFVVLIIITVSIVKKIKRRIKI